MPIRLFLKQGHGFDDEAIRVIYEFARSDLRIIGENKLNGAIAAKIIEFARTGQRDPDKLCDFAIEGLRNPLREAGI